jgi:hypothetical protein
MRVAVAIRTHQWGEAEERLRAQLQPIFGDDLCVVFHNRAADVTPTLPVVDLADDWLRDHGLRILRDYGWRCGDYFMYALRQARPDYDHYWLVEPDVFFAGGPAGFFAQAAGLEADLAGVRLEELPPQHRFAREMGGLPPWKAVFALTRMSARAVDRLFPLRQAYCLQNIQPRYFANDETFCYSHLMADPQMVVADLRKAVPEWFGGDVFHADPDMLFDIVAGAAGPEVFHPVRTRKQFARAIVGRAVASMTYLRPMRASLALLTDAEITALCADLALSTEHAIRHLIARRPGDPNPAAGAEAIGPATKKTL